jgi:hypothetical protein
MIATFPQDQSFGSLWPDGQGRYCRGLFILHFADSSLQAFFYVFTLQRTYNSSLSLFLTLSIYSFKTIKQKFSPMH